MIYVDQFPGTGLGKWQGGGHLHTTNIEELHAFAKSIGLGREWFHNEICPHYDLTASKRRLAFQSGAEHIGWGEFPPDMLWCKKGSEYETTKERDIRIKKWLERNDPNR